MTECRIVTFDPSKLKSSEFDPEHGKNEQCHDSSMCNGSNELDDIDLLRDIFFNLKTSSRTDWSNINIERRHDFKFWADVTHNFGFDILKSVFSIGTSYCDNYNFVKYHIKTVFGDELSSTPNYTLTLRNEVAFHLLSGMIENRIPGSLRLIVRGNGYSFFENRINELLTSKVINHEALCYNMNALMALFPYLLEYKSVNLWQMCFRFVSSKLWKYMWYNVGIKLKSNHEEPVEKMFYTFLELSTVYFYGARGPGFLKKLHSSSTCYLWNSIIPLISWSMDRRILCKIVTFVSDILLLTISDKCLEKVPRDVLKALKHNVKRSLDKGISEGFNLPEGISNVEFKIYHSNICVGMLERLYQVLQANPGDLVGKVHLIYDLSSLSSSKITVPYKCKNIFEPINEEKVNFSPTKIFPRVLPCFNYECSRVYHLDLPQIHLVNNEQVNFFYCKRCGIPSYCSERCFDEHWQISHKEVHFPPNLIFKYSQRYKMPILDP
uniref:MYND-type domain-containing protein n=1 Tax=Theileria annulata TaxID=5874 RepID=A0A3B0MVH6_THEAN